MTDQRPALESCRLLLANIKKVGWHSRRCVEKKQKTRTDRMRDTAVGGMKSKEEEEGKKARDTLNREVAVCAI